MYGNIRDDNNTNLKGEIGEIIAKYNLPEAILIRQYHHTILDSFSLNKTQLYFLKAHWKSFDLINPESLTLYEVKTRKYFNKRLSKIKNRIVITPTFLNLCKEAIQLGFSIKVFEITLFSEWKYGIIIKDFNEDHFWVHRPRPNGWERKISNEQRNKILKISHLS